MRFRKWKMLTKYVTGDRALEVQFLSAPSLSLQWKEHQAHAPPTMNLHSFYLESLSQTKASLPSLACMLKSGIWTQFCGSVVFTSCHVVCKSLKSVWRGKTGRVWTCAAGNSQSVKKKTNWWFWWKFRMWLDMWTVNNKDCSKGFKWEQGIYSELG